MAQLWVDAFSGLSGDLWVGGFLALGVPEPELRAVLRRLPFDDLDLRVEAVMRCGVQGLKASVLIGGRVDAGGPRLELPQGAKRALRRHVVPKPGAHVHGLRWVEVDALLRDRLDPRIAEVARGAFLKLAQAEARVHGMPLEEVHFHEVGVKDSIADVALAASGWVLLGEPAVHVGPVALGTGRTPMAHGNYPIPGPATLNLLDGFELVPGAAPDGKELTTPTGAALAAQLATSRRAPRRFIPRRSAFAAGGWDFPDSPNVARFVLGEVPGADQALLQVETNLDDATPQQVAHAQARLLQAGALDAWVTAATFKKGRSGWVLGMIVEPSKTEALTQVLVAELPTLGLRMWPLQRLEAERAFIATDVEGQAVAVKEGRWPGTTTRQPEFEDAARAAKALGKPLREVQASAKRRKG
ncbi:MAG: LarC family nickel insertion protein [Holophagaceae bacterium]